MIGLASRLLAVALFALLFCGAALSAEFLQKGAEDLKTAPEIERLFVIKTAENLLHENARKMFNDPENETDGFLWARKVLAVTSLGLNSFANELSAPELAKFYKEKADLFSKNIRGELPMDDFGKAETELEARKQVYLESILSSVKPTRNADFERLKAIAKAAADKIHGYSVIAVTDRDRRTTASNP